MPRLLIVNSHGGDPSSGGTEKNVDRLTRGLPSDWEVSLLSAFPVGARSANEWLLHSHDWRSDRWRRIGHHTRDFVAHPPSALGDLLQSLKPDVLHTQNLFGISTGVWSAAQRAGVPVVHTVNDYQLLCPRSTLVRRDGDPCRPSRFLCGLRSQRIARLAPAVANLVGVSEHIIHRHRSLFPTAATHLVRNPYEPPSVEPSRLGASPSRIGYIGQLHDVKGVQLLLAVAPELADMGFEVHFAGDGPLRPQVESAARALPSVHYAGIVRGDERWHFIGGVDVGIVPSTWEEPGAPPQVVLEWLSMERPVLISDRGGLGESLTLCPGTYRIEPTTSGIVAGVLGLASVDAWADARSAARAPQGHLTETEWLEIHALIYQTAISDRRRF